MSVAYHLLHKNYSVQLDPELTQYIRTGSHDTQQNEVYRLYLYLLNAQ
jgi:hypothetical protein